MDVYIKALDYIFNTDKYRNSTDENSTETGGGEEAAAVCTTKIPWVEFHLFLLIPSTLITILLAFTIRRKLLGLSFLDGRPGFVFAMDILGRSNRFSYAAAWGMLAYLAGDIVFDQTYAVDFQGPRFVTVFKALVSMAIYGMDYFPLFASLALESAVGYCVGTAYAWLLFIIQVFQIFECPMPAFYRVNLIFGLLPKLICLGYLSISLPVRLVQAMRNKTTNILSAKEMVTFLNMTKGLGHTVEAVHVKKLLRPVPPPPDPPDTIRGKILGAVKDLAAAWFYRRHSNFRYSARVLSVMVIGVILIYKTTYELMFGIVSILNWFEGHLIALLEFWGWEYVPDEMEFAKYIRETLYLVYYLLIAFRGCFITSLSLSAAFSLLMILHMLSSYRTNLLDLYKGDNQHIPHRSIRSNPSLLVGSMRYAGYQVGYIGWGYFIMFLVLLLISCIIAVIITLIVHMHMYQWLLNILLSAWPVVAMTLILNIVQFVVAKFAFLQERGEFLAINNRRVLFTFTFFMFFYNIFMGIVSCLLRIIKSMIIGTMFLCRLDNSALPRRFQMFDPGFAAYVGMIHVECAHTHPVLVCFLRILLITEKYNQLKKEDGKNPMEFDMIEKGPKSNKYRSVGASVSWRARTRWFLLYTLYNNPGVRVYRKQYIQYMNEMKERLYRHYNLNKTSLGKLIKGVNKSVAPISAAHGNVPEEALGIGANWTALLGANKFLMALQRDMMKKDTSLGQGTDATELNPLGNLFANGNIFGTTKTTTESKENGFSNSASNPTTKPSLWGKARTLAAKVPETTTVNINEGYIEEQL